MTTVQRIFQQFHSQYLQEYTPHTQQFKVINAILNCKTAALGGHVGECNECGHTKTWYNSCRNRHCPMCQGVNKAVWVDKQSENVLDAPYFHLVFTMPEELRELIYQNQKLLYNLMYKAVAQTCKELSEDKKYLGVLHNTAN